MIKFLQKGLCFSVTSACYGLQDLGVSPGGAMDDFSFQCGRILLGEHDAILGLEIIYPPRLEFLTDTEFVLTGACYEMVFLISTDGEKILISHGVVYFAGAGSQLHFSSTKRYGFRTYLSYSDAACYGRESKPTGRARGDLTEFSHWQSADGRVRLLKGPEYDWLMDADRFFDVTWYVSERSDQQGMFLDCHDTYAFNCTSQNMISDVVTDGTIQLTPGGPVVLLKHRQTIGGYPRIFNVISSDVDWLAQFAPGHVVHFDITSQDDSRRLARQKSLDLQQFRDRVLS